MYEWVKVSVILQWNPHLILKHNVPLMCNHHVWLQMSSLYGHQNSGTFDQTMPHLETKQELV